MCLDLCHLLPKRPEGCSSAQIFAVFPSVLVDLTGILLPAPKNPLHKRPLTTKISKPCKILTHSNLCAFKTVPMSTGWTSVCYSCKHSSTKPHFPTFQGWSIPTLIPPSDPSRSLLHAGSAPHVPVAFGGAASRVRGGHGTGTSLTQRRCARARSLADPWLCADGLSHSPALPAESDVFASVSAQAPTPFGFCATHLGRAPGNSMLPRAPCGRCSVFGCPRCWGGGSFEGCEICSELIYSFCFQALGRVIQGNDKHGFSHEHTPPGWGFGSPGESEPGTGKVTDPTLWL